MSRTWTDSPARCAFPTPPMFTPLAETVKVCGEDVPEMAEIVMTSPAITMSIGKLPGFVVVVPHSVEPAAVLTWNVAAPEAAKPLVTVQFAAATRYRELEMLVKLLAIYGPYGTVLNSIHHFRLPNVS